MKASNEEIKGMIKLQAQLQQAHQVIWALHWNMKGERFLSDHPWLDDPLEEVDEMVDWVAERIVQLGGLPLTSYEDIVRLSVTRSAVSQDYSVDSAMSGVLQALNDTDDVMLNTRKNLDEADTPTGSKLDDYLGTLEKYIWMVGSEIKEA
jgi:starvation-inducible DNA-binding protein